MLALQHLLRSRPKWSCGTAHIFWYMMDEHMYFWCHPEIMCQHGSYERFLKWAHTIFGFWIYYSAENANHNTMKRFETFSQWRIRRWNHLLQKSTEREQFLTLSTFKWFPWYSFLAMPRWSAICSSRFGFRVKRLLTIRFVKPSFGWSGGGGQRSRTVRLEARIGELEQLKKFCLGTFGLT